MNMWNYLSFVYQDVAVCPGVSAGDFLSKIGGQLTGAHKFSGEMRC